MADPWQTGSSSDDEESELEKLEEEVNQTAQRILDYRATIPDQFKAILPSVFVSQRPAVSTSADGSQIGPSTSHLNPDIERPVESGQGSLFAQVTPENPEKLQLLKHKISSTASAMPTVVKRMKEFISRIDKSESHNGFIIPAFKRKRTN